MKSAIYPTTPDGRYFVVRGRLWRTNPGLPEAERARLTSELMDARRAVGRISGGVSATWSPREPPSTARRSRSASVGRFGGTTTAPRTLTDAWRATRLMRIGTRASISRFEKTQPPLGTVATQSRFEGRRQGGTMKFRAFVAVAALVTTAGTVRAGCKEDVAQLDPQIQEKAASSIATSSGGQATAARREAPQAGQGTGDQAMQAKVALSDAKVALGKGDETACIAA